MTLDVLETKASDGSSLDGLAGTRYTDFAAITRVDRDAHRALGGEDCCYIRSHCIL